MFLVVAGVWLFIREQTYRDAYLWLLLPVGLGTAALVLEFYTQQFQSRLERSTTG